MDALCCIFSHHLCLMASKHSYSVLRSGHTFAGIYPDWANAKNHVTRLQFLRTSSRSGRKPLRLVTTCCTVRPLLVTTFLISITITRQCRVQSARKFFQFEIEGFAQVKSDSPPLSNEAKSDPNPLRYRRFSLPSFIPRKRSHILRHTLQYVRP